MSTNAAALKAIRTILENAANTTVGKTPVLKADGSDEIDKAGDAASKATPPSASSVKEGDDENAKSKHDDEDAEEKGEEGEEGEEDEEKDDDKEVKDEGMYEEGIDLSAFTALLNQQPELSESFKDSLTGIFEATIKNTIDNLREQIAEEHDEFVRKSIKELKENYNKDILSKLDTYLNYVAEEYMIENALEIEDGLKVEISESFISGLKNLFTQHAIEIPETSVNVVDALAKKCASLEEQLNARINENAELVKANRIREKNQIVSEHVKDLSETDAARFISLVEDVTFTTPAQLSTKLKAIKESFVTGISTKITSTPVVDDIATPGSDSSAVLSEETQTDPIIAAALQHSKRFRK